MHHLHNSVGSDKKFSIRISFKTSRAEKNQKSIWGEHFDDLFIYLLHFALVFSLTASNYLSLRLQQTHKHTHLQYTLNRGTGWKLTLTKSTNCSGKRRLLKCVLRERENSGLSVTRLDDFLKFLAPNSLSKRAQKDSWLLGYFEIAELM